MLVAAFAQYFFGISIFVSSIFLVLLVLVQRGRGGGLTGALGGAGGQSAFGTKAGDLFTRITIAVAAAWIFLCAASVYFLKSRGLPELSGSGATVNFQAPDAIGSGEGTSQEFDLTGGGQAGATTIDPLGDLPALESEGTSPAEANSNVEAEVSELDTTEAQAEDANKTETSAEPGSAAGTSTDASPTDANASDNS